MLLSVIEFFRSSSLRSSAVGRKRNHCRVPEGSRKSGASIAGIETLEPRHTFSVSPVGFDSVPGSTSTSYSIAVGGARANAVNFLGDHDWYRVTLTAGTRYQFNMNATVNSSVRAMDDPFLRLRSGSGTVLASDDDSGGGNNSQISFTATSSGTYFLDAGAYNNACTGCYTVTVRSLGSPDDYAANTSELATVSEGGSRTGVIESSGDHDWFNVLLIAGRNYRFDLTRGSLSDPYLSLRNGSGTLLVSNDDGGGDYNSRINYRPTTTGFFYLDASGFGSSTGSYTLRVTRTS